MKLLVADKEEQKLIHTALTHAQIAMNYCRQKLEYVPDVSLKDLYISSEIIKNMDFDIDDISQKKYGIEDV